MSSATVSSLDERSHAAASAPNRTAGHSPRDRGSVLKPGDLVGLTRGASYPPQTQGKIERYRRTMKNVVKLQHGYFPWELEAALRDFVAYYNNERYYESLDNMTPAGVYFGRQYEVLTERPKIKRLTMKIKKREYLAASAA